MPRKSTLAKKDVLAKEQIIKFQEIYKKCFGEEISQEDALEKGMKAVSMMRILEKPMTKSERKRLEKIIKGNKLG